MLRRLLPLCLVGLALAGCGDDDGEDPFALVTAAGASTTETGTALMSIAVEGGPADATGEGVLDFERGQGSMSVRASGQAVDMAFDGTALYLRLPEGLPREGIGTPWVSLDIARVAEAQTGTDISQIPGATATDPTQSLHLLPSVSDEIEEVGEEEVRGEPTTHYRAVVDIRKAYEDEGAVTDPSAFRAFLDTIGSDEITTDVWIDDEGRVRRQTYGQPVPGGEAVLVTLELYDFGTDEPIEMPSAGEVTDVTERLLGR